VSNCDELLMIVIFWIIIIRLALAIVGAHAGCGHFEHML